MKRQKNSALVSYMGMVTLFLVWMLGLSIHGLALSSTVSIQIDQQPPFFSPRTVSTVAGTVVQWENRTRERHTILADDCLRRGRCSFESRMIEPGGNFIVPNLPPGEYAYHCGIHPFMRGFLIVKGTSPGEPWVPSTDI